MVDTSCPLYMYVYLIWFLWFSMDYYTSPMILFICVKIVMHTHKHTRTHTHTHMCTPKPKKAAVAKPNKAAPKKTTASKPKKQTERRGLPSLNLRLSQTSPQEGQEVSCLPLTDKPKKRLFKSHHLSYDFTAPLYSTI